MGSSVKADIESLESHITCIRNRCEAMLEGSKKFSSNVTGSVWSDNNSERAIDVYASVARSIENIIQILDGSSVILEKQTVCLRDYYNVNI